MSTAAQVTATGSNVGIGQIVASADRGAVLSALGLGSCIALVLADRHARVAGMAHVMLPESRPGAEDSPGRFADTAVPALLDAVLRLGADRARLTATMAGGAQMFMGQSGGAMLNIGERNAEGVRAALQRSGMRLRASDVGGGSGRTLQVAVGTGVVVVRVLGGAATEL